MTLRTGSGVLRDILGGRELEKKDGRAPTGRTVWSLFFGGEGKK